MLSFKRKERTLGVARQKRKYDLPLNKGVGRHFLKLLIALMSILAIFALSASFALSEMTQRWESGLENKATIEVPAEDRFGNILTNDDIEKTSNELLSFLKGHPHIEKVEIMAQSEIKELVSPWLGDNITFENVPLPGIISVNFKPKSDVNFVTLEKRLKNYGEHIRLDTHASWLANLLKFTNALNFAAIFISTLIGVITIVTVAGAIQSRMSIYHEDLELLHLMGASDNYISNQLQRYSFITCLQGSVIGTIVGLLLLLAVKWGISHKQIDLLPNTDLSLIQLGILLALPLFIALLAMFTARQTVLRTLSKMH